MEAAEKKTVSGLSRCVSPLAAWALAFGCAVGWGAFMMPGTTFLPMAGPAGTTVGITVGGLIMLVIGANYHYLMNRYPDAGGTFSYAKRELGYDHGFLSAWFLILVYIAIGWANATALPLVFRNLLGGVFQWGPHYTVVGYDVYLGEVLLSLAALEGMGFLCIRSGKLAMAVQSICALCLLGGILVGIFAASSRHGGNLADFAPAFAPGKNPAGQILAVVALAPWCFVGFESLSHATEELRFSRKRVFLVLCAGVLTATAAYVGLAWIAISALPERFPDWTVYMEELPRLSGLEGLPVFHTISVLLGRPGMILLGVAIVGAVLTGMLGNLTAASRLIFAMARDGLLPDWFRKLNRSSVPGNALLFLMLISLPVPFFGRVAVGWIVDVNTVCAIIAYGYTSVCAYKVARQKKDTLFRITGGVGIAFSVAFFIYFFIPSVWSVGALSTESYMILIVWSVLGFVFFRNLLNTDQKRRFGQSTAVWMAIMFLLFFTSTLWVREATQDTIHEVVGNINSYNFNELEEHGIGLKVDEYKDAQEHTEKQLELVQQSLTKNSMMQLTLVLVMLILLHSVYNLMKKREKDMEVQKIQAEQSSRAKSTFLSNMSHDIRTPLNAIIGYTTLAGKEEGIPPKVSEYLVKIDASSRHLLSLINDVLEMSRIESGKMELDIAPADLVKTMSEVRNLFATQMETKGIRYTVNADSLDNRMVLCDANRLNRVLLNLISNAYKFTPSGGSVTVTLTQTGGTEDTGSYELRVKDTGMGMSPEFAARVFEAYERERTAANIQGTGLGMAITKSIVDLMKGSIRVETEQGKGSEFIIEVDFPLAEEPEHTGENDGGPEAMDFSGVRLLLVEDNEINREIASALLEEVGFVLDTAENGQIAVEKVAASKPGDFQAVLMDIQMPVLNGYDAARAIRALRNPALAEIPIIAMTANAFSEDIQAARDAGMNSHIPKPIDVRTMMETLAQILKSP